MSTRRRFLTSLAAVPLTPAALADPQASPSPTTPAAPGPSRVAAALAEAVKQRFPGLEDAEIAEIAGKIDGRLKAAARLRSLKLGNADEPVTRFSPRVPKR